MGALSPVAEKTPQILSAEINDNLLSSKKKTKLISFFITLADIMLHRDFEARLFNFQV